jgi:hypothetical protein
MSQGASEVIVCPDEASTSAFHKSEVVKKLGGVDM